MCVLCLFHLFIYLFNVKLRNRFKFHNMSTDIAVWMKPLCVGRLCPGCPGSSSAAEGLRSGRAVSGQGGTEGAGVLGCTHRSRAAGWGKWVPCLSQQLLYCVWTPCPAWVLPVRERWTSLEGAWWGPPKPWFQQEDGGEITLPTWIILGSVSQVC